MSSDAVLTAPGMSSAGYRHGFSLREISAGELAKALGVTALREAKQVHGARVLTVTQDRAAPGEGDEEADALVTHSLGVAIAIKVADCVPIVVASPEAVGAIHAGWRGLVKGVIGNGVDALNAQMAKSVRAVIGPCIGVCCFEVGEEVADEILRVSDSSVVDRSRGVRPHVDLRRAARLRLIESGLADEAIEDIAGCTRCDGARFHSYRRDGANAGRHRIAIVRAR